jgi:rubrerythrin
MEFMPEEDPDGKKTPQAPRKQAEGGQPAGGLSGLLKKLLGSRSVLEPTVSAADVLRRLAAIEEDATDFYEGLRECTDLPWVRQFAEQLAQAERNHRKLFLEYASQAEQDSGAEANRLLQPLSEEAAQMLSVRLTMPREKIEKMALYLSAKDALEMAIRIEVGTIALLLKLEEHVPANQRRHIERVLVEERGHKSFLEDLYRKHFKDSPPA